VGAVAGLTLVDAGPVGAQISDLFPTTTAAPGATTTTLLPPLETILNPAPGPTTTAAPLLQLPAPAPGPSTTAAPLLQLPGQAPSTSRTTTFTTTPTPPRTPLRTTASTLARSSRSRAAVQPGPSEEQENGSGGGNEFAASLPYEPSGDDRVSRQSVNMELGAEGEGGLSPILSVAGGLVAAALLAGVIWLKRQVRQEPPLPSDPDWGW
jgi:hypothetical protein